MYFKIGFIFSADHTGHPTHFCVGHYVIDLITVGNNNIAQFGEGRNQIEEADKVRVTPAPAWLTAHMPTSQYRIDDKYKNQKKSEKTSGNAVKNLSLVPAIARHQVIAVSCMFQELAATSL